MPGTTGISRELLYNLVLKKLSARRMVGLIRSQYRSMLFLLMFIAVYSILMSWFTIQRYRSFQAGFYDLGIFNHDFWVRIFNFERISGLQSLIFGGHVAPSLYLLLPFYAIHPCCETLLVLQTVILALAVIPLYVIASETLSSRRLGLAFSAVYLLYPPLHWVNRADFHAQALIPLMFLSMFYFYRRGNLAYAVFLSLTAFTIEFAPLLVIFFGVYALAREFFSSRKSEFSRGALRLPLISIIAGLVILVFQFFLVSELQASYPPMHCQIFGFERALPLRVVRSGAGTEISFDILLRPMTIVDLVGIDYSSKLAYILRMLGFVGFTPLLAPMSLLLAAPWLAVVLLTSYLPYYSTTAHYSAQIIAQIFVASILGVKTLSRVIPRAPRVLPWGLLALTIIMAAGDSPLSALNSHTGNPYDPASSRWWPCTTERDLNVERILQSIPSGASVLATNELASHLSSRSCVSVFRLDLPYPDFVAIDTASVSFSRLEGSYFWSLAGLLEETDYILLKSHDGVKIFERSKSAPIMEIVKIIPIDEVGRNLSKVTMGGRVYFSGKAYSPKGLPLRDGRVHMFASIDGRWVGRSSTVSEWNSEPTDSQGTYDTRRYGEPMPNNGPEWLEIRADGVYINGEIKAWSGDPRGKEMRVFAIAWGFPYKQDLPSSIDVRSILIG